MTSTILEICLAVERRSGVQVTQRWWEKAGLNFGQESRRAVEGTGELEVEGGEGGRWISSGGMEVGNSGVGSRSDETAAGKSKDTYQPKYTKGQRLVPL